MPGIEDFALGLLVGAGAAAAAVEIARRWRRRRATAAPDVPGAPGVPTAPVAVNTPPPGPSDPARSPASDPGAVRLSRRVILHLAAVGRLDPDAVAPPTVTQRGIGAALAADQSALSKVLRRLVAAGVVSVARRHVRGSDRRVNVYGLTAAGWSVAREMRARSASAPGAAPDDRAPAYDGSRPTRS